MSEQMLGADLQQLEDLAAAFETAGAQIAARADELRDKIGTSVEAFVDALDQLRAQTLVLTGDIDVEIQAVGTQAAGVQWTGNNRLAFDTDLGAFTRSVNTGTAAINTDIDQLKTEVDSRFTPVLTQFGVALRDSAGDVNTTTGGMRTAVSTQRANLDEAANVGWTTA